jgi:two-component system, NarL family, sensor kinase
VLATGVLAVVSPEVYASNGLAAGTQALLLMLITWWRYEHASEPERRPLRWLALGLGPGSLVSLIAGFALVNASAIPAANAVFVVSGCGLTACVVIGLVAPELCDVRAVCVGVTLHLVATLVVLAVFSMATAAVELAYGQPPRSPGALGIFAALSAVAYHPTVVLLRQAVDRLLFGDRRRPWEALSLVGERLGEEPVGALRSLREALALPYAALLDGAGDVVAVSGAPSSPVVSQPLRAAEPGLGSLQVGLRPGELALATRDRQVLDVLGPALAQLVQARALGDALRESRADLVNAVEEERRRLQRELHDGLGPHLTGVALTADAARNLVVRDPDRAAQLLAGLRRDTGVAIGEVRRLVEGLRPVALDQLGLVAAVSELAKRLFDSNDGRKRVDIEAAGDLDSLDAAVEVAAYRILTEALTNSARHSRGDHVRVQIDRTPTVLRLAVADGGTDTAAWRPGVGMTSMRERAEMLGGTFDASSGSIRVTLPV